jgi:translation initiation factor 2B subunit (eIF-2B alpha/beta/delta family)
MKDTINPEHYGGASNPYEAIKVIEAHELDFSLGNAIKYILRAGKKDNAVEDLKKAIWYIERKVLSLHHESTERR